MSYTLGDVTLPQPKGFTREFIETAKENLLMGGKTTKRIEHRKEKFVLMFENLTISQVNSIMSEYELDLVRSFTVDETNLSIGPTDVLVDIVNREYPPSGDTYRESLDLILMEVR